MRILAVITGKYGQRHVDNIKERGPAHWKIQVWRAPAVLPAMIDFPEEFVPVALPQADLVLSFAENRGVAELLPDVARVTGAKAVLVGVDNEAWLPPGLAHQLEAWLQRQQVAYAFPKPLCTLTETDYLIGRGQRITYHSPLIAEFARHFGQPKLDLTIDPQSRQITGAEVLRDACCGCAHFVAQGLIGLSVDEAEQKAGLLHHQFPCLASMTQDPDYGDTLMHVSGNGLKNHVAEQVKPFRTVQYIAPGERSN